MVQDCIEAKSEFGMLYVSPKGLVRVGCTAEVLDVAKRYPDGRMDIMAVGRAPFRIVELINAEQYEDGLLLEGAVDYLDDRERPLDCEKTTRTRRALRGLPHYRVWRLSAQRQSFGA